MGLPDATRRESKKLCRLLPAEISRDPAVIARCSGDKWFATAAPDAVALPCSTESVSRILKFADKHRIPVTPRGAGYGYVGGCIPVKGGVVLSLEKMDRILEVNADDFVVVAQPGVITAKLQAAVERKGLFYPPDPASRADCSIGGNIATNAGGPHCLKYGVTRDYVLGLKIVLADGTIVSLGSRTHKNKTGFDLARLFVGSEGMLGIVTEATLKLLPLPPFRACLSVGLDSMGRASRAIRSIFRLGLLPSALEVADAFTLAAAQKRTGSKRLSGCGAHLLMELDGQEKSVRGEILLLKRTLTAFSPLFIDAAFGSVESERLWALRREFSFALRDTGLTKLNEDIVVPRGKLEALFKFTANLQKRHGFPIACFGHAGDGNIHVNIMVDYKIPGTEARTHAALDDLFAGVLDLGGVITGEHGIGLAKKTWWPQAVSPEADQLHRTIKKALDPRNILNPGKFLKWP